MSAKKLEKVGEVHKKKVGDVVDRGKVGDVVDRVDLLILGSL